MSKQYCRYCAFCFEADGFRCSNHPEGKQPHWSENQIKRANNCPNFALSDLGDVITGKQYKPREKLYKHKDNSCKHREKLYKHKENSCKQLSLFEVTE